MNLTYEQKTRLREVYKEFGYQDFLEFLNDFQKSSEDPERLKAFKESLDPKEEIDKIINNNLKWFSQYYEKALKDNDYFHAVQATRNNMLSLLHY